MRMMLLRMFCKAFGSSALLSPSMWVTRGKGSYRSEAFGSRVGFQHAQELRPPRLPALALDSYCLLARMTDGRRRQDLSDPVALLVNAMFAIIPFFKRVAAMLLRAVGYVAMSFVVVAAVACAIEVAARLYVAVRTAGAVPAITAPRVGPAQNMALYRGIFPDLLPEQITALFSVAYRQVYAPWVGFRTDDITSPLVNVRGFVRATIPDRSVPNREPIEVAFFGGSTVQGTHVPDDRTVPASFVRAAEADGTAVRVVNYGQPYYYSKQEAHLFLSLAMDGKVPRVAVFLNGLNDFILPGASYTGKPVFNDAFGWLIAQANKDAWRRALVETTAGQLIAGKLGIIPPPVPGAEFAPPPHVDPQILYRTIASSYVGNARMLTTACRAYGVICLFVLQPVPFLNYDRRADRIVDQRDFPGFAIGYPAIKAALESEPWFFSLDHVFTKPAELPYVDAIHYSPYGAGVLGDLIYRKMVGLTR